MADMSENTHTHNSKRQRKVDSLLQGYDSILGQTARGLLGQLDPPIAKAMSISQKQAHRHQELISGEVEAQTEEGTGYNKGLREAEKLGRDALSEEVTEERRVVSSRLGGMGNVLAITSNGGSGKSAGHMDTTGQSKSRQPNSSHKPVADRSEKHYTVITCLGQSIVLELPELGYSLAIKAGEVVGLLGYKCLHKLRPLMESESESSKTSVLFTVFVNQNTRDIMKKSGEFVAL